MCIRKLDNLFLKIKKRYNVTKWYLSLMSVGFVIMTYSQNKVDINLTAMLSGLTLITYSGFMMILGKERGVNDSKKEN